MVYFGLESSLSSSLSFLNVSKTGPLAILVGALWLNGYLAMNVNKARIKFNVPWPTLYASGDSKEAHLYNCVQRAHQGYLESLVPFLATLFVASRTNPVLASIAGVIFLLGRVVGARAYSSGDVASKDSGAFGYLGLALNYGFTVLQLVSAFLQ